MDGHDRVQVLRHDALRLLAVGPFDLDHAGAGIGDLPPLVRPDLLRDGLLVEVMPKWRFPTSDLSLVHLGNRHIPRPVRVFIEVAVQMAPALFPSLPA